MFDLHLGNISRLTDFVSRSASPENVYGEKGKGGMAYPDKCQEEVTRIGQAWNVQKLSLPLGHKWKCRPCITIPAKSTSTLFDTDGPAVIRHIWLTVDNRFYRSLILRMYWDNEETPSVEVPLGDFFCNGYNRRVNVLSIPVNTNPSGGFNTYFPMPFRKHARITVENLAGADCGGLYYSIDYTLCPLSDEEGYFHAQYRRMKPVPADEDFIILDNIRGKGHYVGVYMAWNHQGIGWWGEGEVKAFIDGDTEYPTICGTGTEDYFGGAWGFDSSFSAPFLGYQHGEDSGNKGQNGMYRFHIMDPIYFQQDLRLTIQALGALSLERYHHFQDDIASVAYWYQNDPHGKFPALDRGQLEVFEGDHQ